MNKVIVVGTGPGSGEYMTPIGQQAVLRAKLIVGARRLLDTFAGEHQEQLIIGADLQAVTQTIIEQYKQRQVVVLVSGDTGLFSFANYLTKHLEASELEFIPGISSIQLMFARLKRPWNGAQILSVHGREAGVAADVVEQSPVTAIITGRPWFPPQVAKYILQMHPSLTDCPVYIGVDLSYQQERLLHMSLGELAEYDEPLDNSVMVIINEK